MPPVADPTAAQPDGRIPKPRWYRLTPDRLLIALLPIVGLLFLSERFRWFAFNEHKNWTVLIAAVVVCLAVVFLLLWFGVSLVSRRRFQFSIRSMLVFVVVVAIVCSWFAVKMQQARRQREVVEAIEKQGGLSGYDDRINEDGRLLVFPGPPWLRKLLGMDFLFEVECVQFGQVTDAGLAHLKELTNLETLDLEATKVTDAGLVHLEGLTGLENLVLEGTQIGDAGLIHLKGLAGLEHLYLRSTQITDAGLVHLKGLANLKEVWLGDTQVTDAGVQDLQKALPNCEIGRL